MILSLSIKQLFLLYPKNIHDILVSKKKNHTILGIRHSIATGIRILLDINYSLIRKTFQTPIQKKNVFVLLKRRRVNKIPVY